MNYILDLITDDLKKNNYIGLKNDFFNCNCKIGNLADCGGFCWDCEPTTIYIDKNYHPKKEGGKNED